MVLSHRLHDALTRLVRYTVETGAITGKNTLYIILIRSKSHSSSPGRYRTGRCPACISGQQLLRDTQLDAREAVFKQSFGMSPLTYQIVHSLLYLTQVLLNARSIILGGRNTSTSESFNNINEIHLNSAGLVFATPMSVSRDSGRSRTMRNGLHSNAGLQRFSYACGKRKIFPGCCALFVLGA